MGDTCTKAIIVLLNLIFFAFGAAILAVGIVFKTSFDDLKDAFVENDDVDLKGSGNTVGIVLISLGSFITFVSLCGCLGACCRVKLFLATYGVLVSIMLIAQIALVIVLTTGAFNLDDKLEDALKKSLKEYDELATDDKSASWGRVFTTFECCGITDPTKDFVNFTQSKDRQSGQNAKYPVSCCKSYHEDEKIDDTLFKNTNINTRLTAQFASNTQVWNKGCKDKIVDWVDDHKPAVIGVGVAVMVVELVLIAMAFFLCSRADKD